MSRIPRAGIAGGIRGRTRSKHVEIMTLRSAIDIFKESRPYDRLAYRWFMAQHSLRFEEIPRNPDLRRLAICKLAWIKIRIAATILAMTGFSVAGAAALSFACESAISREAGVSDWTGIMILAATLSMACALILAPVLKDAFEARDCTEHAISMLPEIQKKAVFLRNVLGMDINSPLPALQMAALIYVKEPDLRGNIRVTEKSLKNMLRTFSLESVLSSFSKHEPCESDDRDDDEDDSRWRL